MIFMVKEANEDQLLTSNSTVWENRSRTAAERFCDEEIYLVGTVPWLGFVGNSLERVAMGRPNPCSGASAGLRVAIIQYWPFIHAFLLHPFPRATLLFIELLWEWHAWHTIDSANSMGAYSTIGGSRLASLDSSVSLVPVRISIITIGLHACNQHHTVAAAAGSAT